MKKSKVIRKPWFWIGLIGILILVVAGARVVSLYHQPLGPALEASDLKTPVSSELPRNTPTIVATDHLLTTDAPASGQDNLSISTPTPPAVGQKEPTAPESVKSPVEICGETAVWNVLVLGSDTADTAHAQGSDLTRVLRVDFQNKTVSIFAFPRDLWVDASHLNLANPSITMTKLGMIFYEARLRSSKTEPKDTQLDGIDAIAKTLAVNFTLKIDHYVALELDKFPAMIDTIGGVSINIPADMTDPRSGMVFKSGEQTLNGIQTAVYARANLGSDLERIERNNQLIMALRQKLLDPLIWIKIPELFLQFRNAVATDFSPEQVNHLACLLNEVQTEAIIQDGVKAEWTTSGPGGSLLWDKPSVFNRLRELGLIP